MFRPVGKDAVIGGRKWHVVAEHEGSYFVVPYRTPDSPVAEDTPVQMCFFQPKKNQHGHANIDWIEDGN